MIVVNRRPIKPFYQERLAIEDVNLIISALEGKLLDCSNTRLQMLIEKLKRMIK